MKCGFGLIAFIQYPNATGMHSIGMRATPPVPRAQIQSLLVVVRDLCAARVLHKARSA
jgi:hypothetical protein